MILTELNFGSAPDLEKGKVEEIAENYIASLFHAGQLCGEYFLTWIGRKLICHGILTGVGANKTRFHSPSGRANLKKVVAAFGRSPIGLSGMMIARNGIFLGMLYRFTFSPMLLIGRRHFVEVMMDNLFQRSCFHSDLT